MTGRLADPTPERDGSDAASWEDRPWWPAVPGGAPVLSVEGFEGPLDWLLELVRARRINLARLSIGALVDAFSTALAAAMAVADRPPLTLARWGDWLVMAADLALLRSRLLLPDDTAGATQAETAAEALRTRLLSRVAMGAAADWLERRDQLGRDVFRPGQALGDQAVRAGRVGDITALLRACLVTICLPADAAERYRVPSPPPWSAADAAVRIRAMLPAMEPGGAPLWAFLPDVDTTAADRERQCRSVVANTFLAGLELTREGITAVEQAEGWALIHLRQGQEVMPDVPDHRSS